MLQTILIALIPIAFIVWRFRRLMSVLQSGRSMTYKVVVGGVIGLLLIARVVRLATFASSSASAQSDTPAAAKPDSFVVAPAGAPVTGPAADAMKLITEGQRALEKCDTTAASLAFQRAAGVGVEMMNADSLAGEPFYLQGLALAGLHDSTSATVLVDEAARLDKKRGVAVPPDRAPTMRHMIALARRKC